MRKGKMASFIKQAPAFMLFIFVVLSILTSTQVKCEGDEKEKSQEPLNEEQLEYAKGSMCGYCEYCKFCKLCDQDCPCEKSASKPNCHMCKYCKFCYLCKICDTVCQPGGVVDTVTSTIVNSIPFSGFNKEEVDKDIDSVKTYINKKKDEL